MFHVWPGEWHEGRDLGGLATTVLANLTTDLDTDSVLRSGWDKEATASKVISRYCYWLPPNRTGNEIDGRMWQVMTAYPDEVMLSCLDVSCCSWFTLHSVFPRFPLSCSSKPDKDKFNNLHEHDDNYINYFKILAVRKWTGQVSGSEWAIRGMYAECFVAKQSISRICCCERDSGLLGIICSFKVQPQPAHHHPQAVGNPRLWQTICQLFGGGRNLWHNHRTFNWTLSKTLSKACRSLPAKLNYWTGKTRSSDIAMIPQTGLNSCETSDSWHSFRLWMPCWAVGSWKCWESG